jgi:hypothetical protein
MGNNYLQDFAQMLLCITRVMVIYVAVLLPCVVLYFIFVR